MKKILLNIKKFFTPVRIVLLLVLIFALVLRVYRIGLTLGFWYDQGRDALVIWDFWHKAKLFLIGPTTGIAGIFRGPWYYWLIAPVYLIAGGNPAWPAAFLAISTVVAIYFLYKIGEKLEGPKTGLLAAFIAAFSFYMVSSARWLSNPTPMFLISVLTVWFLIKFTEGKKYSLIAVAVLTGMAIQFGSAAEIFYIPAILLILWIYRKTFKFKELLMPLFLFFLIFIPQILFNIRHQGIFIEAVRKFLIEDKSFKLSFWQTLKVRLPFYYDLIASKFWINGAKIFAPFFGAIIASLILYGKEIRKNKIFSIVIIFTLAPFIGMLFFQGNGGNVYEYYFTGYFFIFVLLASYALRILARSAVGKIVLTVFLTVFIFRNAKTTIPYAFFNDDTGPSAVFLGNEKKILDWIYTDAGAKPFNVDTYVPPVIPHAYDYLFKWYGGKVHGREPDTNQVPLLYTIYEIDPPHPERLDTWLKRQATIGKVEQEIRFGGITVQRRSRITK